MNIKTKLKRFIDKLIGNVEDSEDTKNSINKTDLILDKCNKLYDKWFHSMEYARLKHVCALIVTAYETINVKANSAYYTSDDYLEDYKVFFRPEVFNKLQEWCREFNVLIKKELEVLHTLQKYQ